MPLPSFVAGDPGQFSVTSTTYSPVTKTYPVNVVSLNEPGAGFEVGVAGEIVQGTTAESVIFALSIGSDTSSPVESVTLTVPSTAFTASATVEFEAKIRVISQGGGLPNSTFGCHYVFTILVGGTTPVIASTGFNFPASSFQDNNNQNFPQLSVFLQAEVGASGPTVTSFLSWFETITPRTQYTPIGS